MAHKITNSKSLSCQGCSSAFMTWAGAFAHGNLQAGVLRAVLRMQLSAYAYSAHIAIRQHWYS